MRYIPLSGLDLSPTNLKRCRLPLPRLPQAMALVGRKFLREALSLQRCERVAAAIASLSSGTNSARAQRNSTRAEGACRRRNGAGCAEKTQGRIDMGRRAGLLVANLEIS